MYTEIVPILFLVIKFYNNFMKNLSRKILRNSFNASRDTFIPKVLEKIEPQ